jgi:hypothetical protein
MSWCAVLESEPSNASPSFQRSVNSYVSPGAISPSVVRKEDVAPFEGSQ